MSALSSSFCSNFSLADNESDAYTDIDWDNVGFGITPTDYMYIMKCSNGDEFKEGQLIPYGNLEFSPAAAVINYGQGVLEGMKVLRREDGKIMLFRPDQNASRMKIGAERMCMPSPSIDQFIDAVKQTALANKRWIPPPGKGALYIRPLLLGTGPTLGLSPAPEYTFVIYASPVGDYFKVGSSHLNLYIEEEFDRASRGGSGGIKSITNYAPGLRPLTNARSNGFSDVLYLDSATRKYVEEVSSCNIFVVKNNIISTPPTKGTVLPGITRKSVIEIAIDLGYQASHISDKDLFTSQSIYVTISSFCVSINITLNY
ncbi:branched-chain-amino-acid aminotransferase 2, chloroplastic-like [Beta vulgaris subsp. vulgaris]|uniref:branched-chain-amino-acid aminotransferase 2, chloroplastic-like n=1 Tax=Beta vulgaris subsp. vulgaris TaxID=3555 RepID=UPI0020373748|nr:branched-chain-amino-acid aminotransferase 2, chloroplastic-like [Beta vulgaris subsp. vulgaris]